MGEGTQLNRPAYEELIKENIEWLEKQPDCLERRHIKVVLEWSIKQLYGTKKKDE